MTIGIIRHFKVDYKSSFKMNSDEFNLSMDEYDDAPIIFPEVNPLKDLNWDLCFTSDLPRAVKTAEYICNCKRIYTELLKEVPMQAFFETKRKFSAPFWHVTSRIFWKFSKNNQIENYKATVLRINKALDLILSRKEEKILIVSHGFYLRQLIKRLREIGFKGKTDSYIRNGRLYVLSN
jgi:broad specificity phosphatase PhoE